jgi:hypothetical protein
LILALPTLIGGSLLLMISDKFLQSKFGWEAFEEK